MTQGALYCSPTLHYLPLLHFVILFSFFFFRPPNFTNGRYVGQVFSLLSKLLLEMTLRVVDGINRLSVLVFYCDWHVRKYRKLSFFYIGVDRRYVYYKRTDFKFRLVNLGRFFFSFRKTLLQFFLNKYLFKLVLCIVIYDGHKSYFLVKSNTGCFDPH